MWRPAPMEWLDIMVDRAGAAAALHAIAEAGVLEVVERPRVERCDAAAGEVEKLRALEAELEPYADCLPAPDPAALSTGEMGLAVEETLPEMRRMIERWLAEAGPWCEEIRELEEVLEERRDLLAREMLDSIRRCESLLAAFRQRAEEAVPALQHGFDGLTAFAAMESTLPAQEWRLANHAGVELLEAPAAAEPADPPAIDEGFLLSPELERARLAFQRLLEAALPLAAEENNLRRLTAAFRAVRRRVNALEHVILPETEQAIREIEEGLEQTDREQMVTTLWVKRRMEGGR